MAGRQKERELWHNWVRYYDSIQEWAKDQLAGSASFNQVDLLHNEDHIVRIIGLTCLRDFISEKKDGSLVNLYFPVFNDKNESVRLMAYRNALSQSLAFVPDKSVSYRIVEMALEDRRSKEIGSTILRSLREILDRRAPKEVWAKYLPLAKKAIVDWHEPTRVEAAYYIGHCIGLGLLKNPLEAIDFILNYSSIYLTWGISWLVGSMKGQLMEDPANIGSVFNRYKDYSVDKYPELHLCLTGSFARRGPWMDALENNKEIQNYLANLFSSNLMNGGFSSVTWIADRTFSFDHPVKIACYREAVENDNPEVRAWGNYWLNKVLERSQSKQNTRVNT